VSPAVTMQLDTGNCASGGGDPIAMLKKYPGRAVTLHVKEYEGAPLTATNAVWKEIVEICKEHHRTSWYIIEQGEAQGAGFEIAKESLAAMRALLNT
jgi:sugar phosphate isomerase/epimerase